ncbi:MAG: RnfABCDGE type electron transport complex subunit G [Candidatus Cloacimonadota bacterium]|nr:RnfABCDGE type electron transport complex subunit G [Candidatus Cloacimonadota bacterium]
MKNIIKPTLVLLVICVIASTVLAFLYQKTAPIIAENNKIAERDARKVVLPEATKFLAVDGQGRTEVEKDFSEKNIKYYEGFSDDKLVGYIFKCGEKGYSSYVKTIVGIANDKDFTITGIKIVSQQETPGLGANCVTPGFAAKFKGKNPATIYVNKDGGDIVAITGATITTRTVTNSIRDEFDLLKKDFKDNQEGAK